MTNLPESLIIHPHNLACGWSAECSTDCLKRQWEHIITDEKQAHQESQSHLMGAVVIAFAADSTLPKDIALEVVSFMKTNISPDTITRISRLVLERRKWEISTNGRRGESHFKSGLKYSNPKQWLCINQYPRLPFSQPDFHKQIRERAHHILFRLLDFHGDMETQLSAFINYLINDH